MPQATSAGAPTLTFRGGGWVIVLTLVLVAGLLTWALLGVMSGTHPVGDGRTLASYGFALEPLKADRAYLVSSGNPRDFLQTLDNPSTIRGAEMLDYNQNQRRKYVVTTDRVAGVALNGEARAYPLHVLNAHEVINDTLGGVPIAVSYSPLTDSVVVFDRRVGGASNPPRLFKVSGLLYNSNLVMYDQAADAPAQPGAPAAGASLWSQLGLRAVAGPAAAAGAVLEPLPGVNIATWKQWLALHPDTTVVAPDPGSAQRYKEFSYARYYLTPRVDYPVAALPQEQPEFTQVDEALAAVAAGKPTTRKTPVLRVRAGGQEALWTLYELLQHTNGQDGEWTTTLGGVPLKVNVQRSPAAAVVQSENGAPVLVIPQLHFAERAFAAERP